MSKDAHNNNHTTHIFLDKLLGVKFRFFDLILAGFAVCLVISNIASTKTATLDLGFWKPIFDGGTFLFPITYIFGDVLTEVYGYKNARRVIWFGLAMSVFSSLVFALVGVLPTHESSFTKGAFELVLGFVPQIVLASAVAFFVGEFLNSFVLAKLKVRTKGKFFAARAIGSTLVGQAADTIIFSVLAFGVGANAMPSEVLYSIILSNYLYKVGLEVALTPLTTAVVGFLKRAEGVDSFDTHTNFNPFGFGAKKTRVSS
jgi:queuosine precursor transporter